MATLQIQMVQKDDTNPEVHIQVRPDGGVDLIAVNLERPQDAGLILLEVARVIAQETAEPASESTRPPFAPKPV